MSNQALKYLALIIFILALLVWGGVGYLYFNQNLTFNLSHIKLPQVNLSSLTWKTYQNKFLSFTFKYPSNLTYTSEFPQEPQLYEGVSFYDAKQGSSEEALFSLQINQVSPSDHKIFNYASRAVPEQPVTFEEALDTGGKGVFSISPFNSNSQDWVKVVVQKDNQNGLLYLTAVKNSQAVYTVSLYGTADLLEDIVKTFSFIKT